MKSNAGRKRSPLNTDLQRFANPAIFQIDAKLIDLERMMVNLFALLRYDGKKVVMGKSEPPTVSELAERLSKQAENLLPVADPQLLQKWLESDFLNLVNRGEPGREAVASLRPFHLESYKIRSRKHCRDYGSAPQAFALLRYGGDPTLLGDLRDFLGDEHLENGEVDLVSRVVRLLTSEIKDHESRDDMESIFPPICPGQARLLANDIRRLLCYRSQMPRPVLVRHMQTVFGLHLGIYTLRLSRVLPAIYRSGRWPPECSSCSMGQDGLAPMAGCPFSPRFVVDMHQDGRTQMGALSRENAAAEYARLNDFIRAMLGLNQVWEYAGTRKPDYRLPETLQEAISYWDPNDPVFEGWAGGRVRILLNSLEEHLPEGDWEAVKKLDLPPFETYVELVTHLRHKYHKSHLVRMLDSLFQKQQQRYHETGFVKQGRSKGNGRRFHIASRLLETLVHIAVLKQQPHGSYRSEAMLVDDFVGFVYQRYGMVLNRLAVTDGESLSIEELQSWRSNMRALKDRLREIGFYSDLSDAYNAQTIRPRYAVGREGE